MIVDEVIVGRKSAAYSAVNICHGGGMRCAFPPYASIGGRA
jgi:hypothetical protein